MKSFPYKILMIKFNKKMNSRKNNDKYHPITRFFSNFTIKSSHYVRKELKRRLFQGIAINSPYEYFIKKDNNIYIIRKMVFKF